MERIEATFIDKSNWPEGPWRNEPDFVAWEEGGTRFFLIRHEFMGHWMGFVGVPKDHGVVRVFEIARIYGLEGVVAIGYFESEEYLEGLGEAHDLISWIQSSVDELVPGFGREGEPWWAGVDLRAISYHPGFQPPILDLDKRHLYKDLDFAKGQLGKLAKLLRA